MKLTVITVCYNCADTLAETMQSVLQQTCQPEYVLIDGASTDGTIDIILSFQKKYPQIRYISEPDNGIYDAMNKGVKLATGDYINFMNSGDGFISSDAAENLFRNFKDSPPVIYGDYCIRYPDNSRRFVKSFPPAEIWKPYFNHQCAFAKRELLLRYGLQPEDGPAADFCFVYKCAVFDGTPLYEPVPVNYYLAGGYSSGYELSNLLDYRKTVKKYGISLRQELFYQKKIIWIFIVGVVLKKIVPTGLFYRLQKIFRKFFPENRS